MMQNMSSANETLRFGSINLEDHEGIFNNKRELFIEESYCYVFFYVCLCVIADFDGTLLLL